VNDGEIHQARVVIVDDTPANTALLEALLRRWGFTSVTASSDSAGAVALCEQLDPDLVLLDLHMPAPDGFEVLRLLTDRLQAPVPLPVIVLTADVSGEAKRRALQAGARDFLTKPFDPEEVRLRVTNLLTVRFAQRAQAERADILEREVRARTSHLEASRLEIVQRLGRATEHRDDATGQHTARVARTAGLLARGLGLSAGEIAEIAAAAPLHDIGKIGVSDTILLKPGRLTDDEFDQMKQHVRIGGEILAGSNSSLLQVAEQIALTHHERWDGGGYLAGLAGEEIPLAGRIVAVADVFDALTHRRPYKDPWPVDRAVDEIAQGAGGQFDSGVVEVFTSLDHDELIAPLPPASWVPAGTGI